MPTFKPGQLVLLRFPFTIPDQSKRRPALVLVDAGDGDLLLARVTTHLYRTPYDANLKGWEHAGLLKPSVARLHKLATLDAGIVEKALGTLDPEDWNSVLACWNRIPLDNSILPSP